MLKHIIVKLLKTKHKGNNRGSSQEKMTHYLQREMTQMKADFWSETTETKRKEHKIFQRLKEKNCQSRIIPGENIFQNWEKIKTFLGKGNWVINLEWSNPVWIAKGSCLNKEEIVTEGILKHWLGKKRTTKRANYMDKYKKNFPSPFNVLNYVWL